jgi:hypothetical protein
MRFLVHADHAVILLAAGSKIALLLRQDTRLVKLPFTASPLLAANGFSLFYVQHVRQVSINSDYEIQCVKLKT